MPNDADETVTVAVKADTADLATSLSQVGQLSKSFGTALGSALDQAAVKGRSLDSVLAHLALRLSSLALNAALKPIESGLGSLLNGLVSSAAGAVTPFAKGGVAPARAIPFAGGGVVAAPTYFAMNGGQLGLAGEAGAEAILPLARDDNGRLGVRTTSTAAPTSVTVNIATPNVESFRRSEAQVAAALARAVGRGRRGL
jgi:phage-related minor tail protein